MESVLPIPEAMERLHARFIEKFEVVTSEDWNFEEVPNNTALVQILIEKASVIMKQTFTNYVNARQFSEMLQTLARVDISLIDARRVVDELYGEIYDRAFRLHRAELDSINEGVEKLQILREDPLSFRYKHKINYLIRTELLLKEGEKSKTRVICYAKNGTTIEDTSFTDDEWVCNSLLTKINATIRHIECPMIMPVEKRGTIPMADRLWRYNYYIRVFLEIIPKRRPCDADGSPSSTAYTLLDGIPSQTPTYSLPKYDVQLDLIREVPIAGIHHPIFFDGKWQGQVLNPTTGMFEFQEVDSDYRIYPFEKAEDVIECIQNTPLPPPPSQRAVGYEVKMDLKAKDRWISRCPDWMKPWAVMLVKPKDGSWTK
jgi:hypothetical protein